MFPKKFNSSIQEECSEQYRLDASMCSRPVNLICSCFLTAGSQLLSNPVRSSQTGVPENHHVFPLVPLPVAQAIPHPNVLPLNGLCSPIRKLREDLREMMDPLENQIGKPRPTLPAARTRLESRLGRRRVHGGLSLTESSIQQRTLHRSPDLVNEVPWL
jgi:hypothetical protein